MAIAFVLVAGLALGILLARLSKDQIAERWKKVYWLLNVMFGMLVVLGAWLHKGVPAEMCFAGLVATAFLMYLVHRARNGQDTRA